MLETVGNRAIDLVASQQAATTPQRPKGSASGDELKTAFNDFVGQTFYGQMLKSLRKSVGKAPYFDGGQTEEIFRSQLDQVIAEKLSDASTDTFSGPMFDLFQLNRR